jgi:hypothetical protein
MHSFHISLAKHLRRTHFNLKITILEVELVTSKKYSKGTRSYKANPEEIIWKKFGRLFQGICTLPNAYIYYA